MCKVLKISELITVQRILLLLSLSLIPYLYTNHHLYTINSINI